MGTPNNTSPLPSKSANSKADEERIREALRLWVQNNKILTDIFLDAYCIVDPANHVVDFNVAFTELCGESYRKILKIADFCELVKTEMCPGQCPARQIATSQKAVRLDELSGVTKTFPSLQMIIGGVPLFTSNGEYIGALITIRNVSAESELQKKYDERKKESIMDGLTRLYNKVYTESLLLRMIQGAFREIQTVSLVMCDIDHFKQVNDTFGHPAGDYVLTTIAQMLKGETRETDIVGRVGGEEFLVILANSDKTGAMIFSERFRKRVESTQVYFEGKHVPVTVSLGTATVGGKLGGPHAETVTKQLVAQSDTALYFAKANGRNQTRQFEELPPSEAASRPVKKKK